MAPNGVSLQTDAGWETEAYVVAQVRRIFPQSGLTDARPPPAANVMEPRDRVAIVGWHLAA